MTHVLTHSYHYSMQHNKLIARLPLKFVTFDTNNQLANPVRLAPLQHHLIDHYRFLIQV